MEKIKKWFWVSLTALVAVLAVGILFSAIPATVKFGNSFVPSHTLTVTATGKTTASPDLAEVTFSVVTQGQNPKMLSDSNNRKMSAVIQFVKSEAIADGDITTTGYDLSPNYQWDKFSQRNYITGYTLTQTVQVKIHDLAKVAEVIGGLAPLGVNQVSGVAFMFNDNERVLAAARADAFAKATAKAQEMAAEAGVSLGSPVTVAETNYIPMPRPYSLESAGIGMGGGAVAPTIQPGTQDITDTVTITYETK